RLGGHPPRPEALRRLASWFVAARCAPRAPPILIEESMKTGCTAVLCTALAVCSPSPSRAAEGMTLEAALELAKRRSPSILASRGRVAEAEARLRTRPPLRDNPEIDAARGSRNGAAASDFEVALSQRLELGGRGGARHAIDEAALARDGADTDETERTVLREVRSAFLRC